MKYHYITRFLLIAAAGLLLGACSKRTVSLQAMRPAEITFPSYVKTLVLVDRTKFNKSAVNILEGVLTGELPGEDKAAMQEAMASLQTALMHSPRFQVKLASEILEGNSITSAFPEPITWTKIEALCSLYNADAVVAFEMFDSDFILTNGKRKKTKEVKDANGKKQEVEVDEYYAQGVANVAIGFRLYDPKAHTIVDQQRFTQTRTWDAAGNTIQEALAALIIKSEASKQVARSASDAYAFKIAPMPIYIQREFYAKSRKSETLEEGARQGEVSDWEGAIETWEKGLNKGKKKDRGKIAYDMAVAYEVLGDLESAKKWAQKSYVDYGNKKARNYSKTIEYRMREEEKLKKQMEQAE
jgi:hypothetical protein